MRMLAVTMLSVVPAHWPDSFSRFFLARGAIPASSKREQSMRQKNIRLVIVGVVLVLAAPAFFFFFLNMAPKSNDPAALIQTVGQVAGVVGAIGLVMLVFGLIGKNSGAPKATRTHQIPGQPQWTSPRSTHPAGYGPAIFSGTRDSRICR
jgi:hypothetical protein